MAWGPKNVIFPFKPLRLEIIEISVKDFLKVNNFAWVFFVFDLASSIRSFVIFFGTSLYFMPNGFRSAATTRFCHPDFCTLLYHRLPLLEEDFFILLLEDVINFSSSPPCQIFSFSLSLTHRQELIWYISAVVSNSECPNVQFLNQVLLN